MVGGKIGENNCDNYLPLFLIKGCLSVYFWQDFLKMCFSAFGVTFLLSAAILMPKCFRNVFAMCIILATSDCSQLYIQWNDLVENAELELKLNS